MDVKSLIILKCFCVLILYFNPSVEGDIPYGLCANPTCSVPVSKGKTILRYSSPDDSRISVEPNENVDIFVKDVGPKKDLWGVIVEGNKGYVSKQFIREMKVLVKNLVPATVEFKTSLLVTNSYSHHVPDNLLHTPQVVQQDVISPLPTGVQPQINKPSENLQASHLSPEISPSHSMHLDLLSGFDVPDHSSHFSFDYNDMLSSSEVIDLNSENIFPSQSYVSNTLEGLNKIPNIQPKNPSPLPPTQSFDLGTAAPNQGFQSISQQLPNVPQQHFQPSLSMQQHSFQPSPSIHHQNVQPPSSIHQQNFQPSPSMHHQNVQPTSGIHQQNSQPRPSMHSQDFQHLPRGQQQNLEHPSSIHQRNFQPLPSVQQERFEQPSSMHQQQFQSSPVQEKHSSDSLDYDIMFAEEYSKTMALLNSRGLGENTMDADSYLHQPSQNVKLQFDTKLSEFSEIPSHAQQPPISDRDSSFYSSSNINPSDTQDQPLHSEVQESNKEDIHVPPEEHSESIIQDTAIDREDAIYKALRMELDAEMDVYDGMERDGEEDEEEDTAIVNSKSEENTKANEPIIESSMTSTPFGQESSKVEEVQSSNSDSSSFSGENLKEQPVIFSKQQETIVSSQEPLSSYEENLRESMNFEGTNVPPLEIQTSVLENFADKSSEINLNLTSTLDNLSDVILDHTMVDLNLLHSEIINDRKIESEKDNFIERDIFSDVPDRNNNDALQGENGVFKEKVPKINEFFAENEQKSEMNKFVNALDVDGIEDLKNTYQVRNLKGESVTTEEQQLDSDGGQDENITQSDSDIYSSFENGWNALKSTIDSVMSWIPEPLYSVIMGLQEKGMSPRVPVFTVICGFTIIFLIVPLIYIKEYSKEAKLSAQLASVEKDAYTFSATNVILEEKLETLQNELKSFQTSVEEERTISDKMKSEFEKQSEELENAKAEFESCLDEYESLREKETEYISALNNYEKEKNIFMEQKTCFEKIITDHSESIANLKDQLLDSERNVEDLQNEKIQYEKLKEDYDEKLSHFERNCNQLLQEAEVWNLRVNELTSKLNEEKALKEEIEASSKDKDGEIESLKQLVETFESFEEIEDLEEQTKTKEEKLQALMNSSLILSQLKKQEDETKVLIELLEKEKSKILDMEVELLEAKSEIDKLKMSYNQALQDKAEAQTKLDVLTNYFKDKEIQLQKQLGAQEAVRQKKEEDASSAERRIVLIEQENASYKYQVASMKQEMEETERNLKSQIAVQEKKAHENWIAARAAERKLEDMKQEVTQIRQRLTLLEREQENWTNASRDEIIRPVPKRVLGVNDESGSQDMNTSERSMFPPPMMPPPPMMLPPDRPLPPLIPPPMFMPPMERHFRPQPWHLPRPDPGSDFRTTPPEFIARRESTPPRRRQFDISDSDIGPHASSPLTTDTRDSRNSTPPHLLPDFHDVPPQPGRPPFFPPPPLGHPRLPMHPQFRRDMGPEHKRLDNPNEYNSRDPQQPPSSQEQWQHSRV